MPIFITQPYIYIANNYDNFNCLVEQLGRHSFGLKGLFPLWALTGLKFLFPSLVNFPLYVTKEELTTVTLFYDAYYDFGVFGMIFSEPFWARPATAWSVSGKTHLPRRPHHLRPDRHVHGSVLLYHLVLQPNHLVLPDLIRIGLFYVDA